MLCYVETARNQNEVINWILQYGHVVWKDCFAVFTASWFQYNMLCPNLVTVQKENTTFSQRIIIIKKYSSTKNCCY